jgi:hypothetical protein
MDEILWKAGKLYRRDYGKSHGVGLADAILAVLPLKPRMRN